MLGFTAKLTTTPKQVYKATDQAAYRNFFHAAASIRKTARASIRTRKTPRPPGSPVTTRRGGGYARRAVLYAADAEGAVIGFAASKIDQAMEAHEHGRERGGVRFPRRPTMQPALEQNLARFHREWRGAIG